MEIVGADNPGLNVQTLEYFFNAVDWHFAVLSDDGRVQFANLAFRRFVGPAAGAHDSKLTAMLTPSTVETFEKAVRELTAGQTRNALYLTFRIGRDELNVQAEIQRAADGSIYYSARDRTDENNSELARKEAFNNLNRLEDVLGIGNWRISRNGHPEWSAGMFRLYGLDARNGPPTFLQFSALLHDEDKARLSQAYDACLSCGHAIQITYRITTPAGEEKTIEVAGSRSTNADGDPIGIYGVAIDRTTNAKAIDAALNTDNNLKRFLEHVPISLVLTDIKGRISLVSQRWLDVVKLDRNQVLGRELAYFWEDMPEEVRDGFSAALKGEHIVHENFKTRLNGKDVNLRWSCTPWYHHDQIGGCVYTHIHLKPSCERATNDSFPSAQPGGSSAEARWVTDIRDRTHTAEGDWSSFGVETPSLDFFPKLYLERVPASDREKVREAWREHVANQAPFQVAHAYIGPDDQMLVVETTVELEKDRETGKPVRVSGRMIQVADAAAAQDIDAGPSSAVQAGFSQVSVLLATDDPIVQAAIRRALMQPGIDLVVVSNGQDAVEAVKTHQFDAIMIDETLSEMDGFEAASCIRAFEASRGAELPVPVFALSDELSAEQQLDALSAGVSDFMGKPFQLEQLWLLLDKHVPHFTHNRDEVWDVA